MPDLCPGGCGEVLRHCCDSVIGQDHQSHCEWLRSLEDGDHYFRTKTPHDGPPTPPEFEQG